MLVLCPLCQQPRSLGGEGEVCAVHPQRLLIPQPVWESAQGDRYLGLVLADKYELHRPLGHGGFGSVYYGVQRGQIRREVAVKLLTKESPEYLDLFRDEMRMVAQLRSPYTVRYLDSGVHLDALTGHSVPFMVMEYLQGQTLAHQLIHQGALEPDLAIELFSQLLESLDEAHSFEIVHRDLKPLNLMITPTRVGGVRLTVLDFGVARVVDQASREATRNRIMGTPYYLAPETLLHQEVTPSGDLFAVAVILYESLLCRSPYLNEELQGVEPYLKLRQIYKDNTPYLSLPKHLAPRFGAFFERALAIDPQARFGSALEMFKALKACDVVSVSSPAEGSPTALDLVTLNPDLDLDLDEDQPTRSMLSPRDETLLNPLPPSYEECEGEVLSELSDEEATVATTRPHIFSSDASQRPPLNSLSHASPSTRAAETVSAPSPTRQRAPVEPPRFARPEMSAPLSHQESLYQGDQRGDLPLPSQAQPPAPRPYQEPFHHFALPTNMHELPLPRRSPQQPSRWPWGLLIVFVLITMTMSVMWWQRAPALDPCVISAPSSSRSSSLEVLTPPSSDTLERLKSDLIERPCLSDEQGACEGQVMRCELPALLAQRDALSPNELSLCQQAGGCEGLGQAVMAPSDDPEPRQGTHIGGCQASSTEACVVYEQARQYCAWRGLHIPTINAWERVKTARSLSIGQPYWVLSPYGVVMSSSPLSADVQPSPSHTSFDHELKLADPNERAAVLCVREL